MMLEALTTPRKPRIAIMGEFSAGKSTLCNLILGARPLPEKVTATRLSPIWMSKGTEGHHRVRLNGVPEPVTLENLESVEIEDTRVIRLFFDADLLDFCDIIDFPGISDPNMDSEVWERVLVEADAVIWLTHATQAWRQTEAAVWESVPEHVRENSILLVTRYDKLVTENDRRRVLARLRKETEGQFAEIFPISLTEALDGRDDFELWKSSGAADFTDYLVNMVQHLSTTLSARSQAAQAQGAQDQGPAQSAQAQAVPQKKSLEDALKEMAAPIPTTPAPEDDSQAAVTPRRVRGGRKMMRVRPARRSAAESL